MVLLFGSNGMADEPSNEKELKAGKKAPALKRSTEGMSEEQIEWERLLQENLGSFYFPRYLECKKKGRETAWDYVEDDPKLPRVLLIGDSISRGYTVPVRHALKGKVNVHRAPENCGNTTRGLQKLDIWLWKGQWDVIHFNFGIHDQRSDPKEYGERLEKIVLKLKETKATLIWASSTPLPDGAEKYRHGACAKLNEVAEAIMKKHDVRINDLYEYIKPDLAKYQRPNDCHFSGEGYQHLGKRVAEEIRRTLKSKKRRR